MKTEPYDLSDTNYYISVGVFDYDTSFLLFYAPDEYARYFSSGVYDGWSYGSLFHFSYYKFTDDSQSFGACLSDGKCWGAWLIYDSERIKYYAYYIGFTYDKPVTTFQPQVPAVYESTFVYEYYHSLHTYYMPEYSWYYLGTTGALFFKWMPVA